MGRGRSKLPLRINRTFISRDPRVDGRKIDRVRLEFMVDNGATPVKVDNGRRK